jgi:hypothetical protein
MACEADCQMVQKVGKNVVVEEIVVDEVLRARADKDTVQTWPLLGAGDYVMRITREGKFLAHCKGSVRVTDHAGEVIWEKEQWRNDSKSGVEELFSVPYQACDFSVTVKARHLLSGVVPAGSSRVRITVYQKISVDAPSKQQRSTLSFSTGKSTWCDESMGEDGSLDGQVPSDTSELSEPETTTEVPIARADPEICPETQSSHSDGPIDMKASIRDAEQSIRDAIRELAQPSETQVRLATADGPADGQEVAPEADSSEPIDSSESVDSLEATRNPFRDAEQSIRDAIKELAQPSETQMRLATADGPADGQACAPEADSSEPVDSSESVDSLEATRNPIRDAEQSIRDAIRESEQPSEGSEADSGKPIASQGATTNLVDSPCPEATVTACQSESPTFLDAPEACPETQSSEAAGPSDHNQSESFQATPLDAPTQPRKAGSFRLFACFQTNQRKEDSASVPLEFPSPEVISTEEHVEVDSEELVDGLVEEPCPQPTAVSCQSESPTFADASEACPENQGVSVGGIFIPPLPLANMAWAPLVQLDSGNTTARTDVTEASADDCDFGLSSTQIQDTQMQSESFQAPSLVAPTQSRKSGSFLRMFACFQDNESTEPVNHMGSPFAPLEFPSPQVVASEACLEVDSSEPVDSPVDESCCQSEAPTCLDVSDACQRAQSASAGISVLLRDSGNTAWKPLSARTCATQMSALDSDFGLSSTQLQAPLENSSDQMQTESFQANSLEKPTRARKSRSSRIFACFQDNQRMEPINDMGSASLPLEFPSPEVAVTEASLEADSNELVGNHVDAPRLEATATSGQSESHDAPEACPESQSSKAELPIDQMQSLSFQTPALDSPIGFGKSGSFRALACFRNKQRMEPISDIEFPTHQVVATEACLEADDSEPCDSLVDASCPEPTPASCQSASCALPDAPEACPETQSSEEAGPSDHMQSERSEATSLDAPTQSRLLNLSKAGGSFRLFACFQDNQHVEPIGNLGFAGGSLELPSREDAASSYEAEALSCH